MLFRSIPEMKQSEFIGDNSADFHFGNGYIRYRGTDNELDDLLRKMSKDQTYFKVIGIFDDEAFNTLND